MITHKCHVFSSAFTTSFHCRHINLIKQQPRKVDGSVIFCLQSSLRVISVTNCDWMVIKSPTILLFVHQRLLFSPAAKRESQSSLTQGALSSPPRRKSCDISLLWFSLQSSFLDTKIRLFQSNLFQELNKRCVSEAHIIHLVMFIQSMG